MVALGWQIPGDSFSQAKTFLILIKESTAQHNEPCYVWPSISYSPENLGQFYFLQGYIVFSQSSPHNSILKSIEMAVLISQIISFRLENSPYSHLLDDALWHEISEMFVKDACALMGLSIESPLSVVVNAGSAALPALLNIKQVST